MTPHLDAIALLPEIILVVGLAVVFLVDLTFDGDRHPRMTTLLAAAVVASAAVCASVLLAVDRHASLVNGTYIVDDFALATKVLVLGSGLIVVGFGFPQRWAAEYFELMIGALIGMLMIVSARELVVFFVAFELLAMPGYLLTAWNKNSAHGHEGAFKYYVLGVVATALLLYGFSLLFGIAGDTKFVSIREAIERLPDSSLLAVAVLFSIVGMAFKIAAVPLHFWAPDAYEAAPIPVAAFLSVATKIAGLAGLAVFVLLAIPNLDEVWAPVLVTLAIASMTIGNLAALRQRNLIRLLAYSSIAQAGYALVPLAVSGRYGGDALNALQATLEFLAIYAVSNLAAFGIAHSVAMHHGGNGTSLRGLFHRAPLAAVTLTAALVSLAGIPPLGGWFAKLVVLRAAVEAWGPTAIALAVVVALNSVVALVYYAGVIKDLWLVPVEADTPPTEMQQSHDATRFSQASSVLAIGFCVIAMLLIGILPGLVTDFGEVSWFHV